MKNGALYLGNILVMGKYNNKEFDKLKERIQHKLEGW